MAPPPDRDRQGRQQMYNDIGNQGRITGVRPPSNVPRDSAGNERPSAYFNHDDDDDNPSENEQDEDPEDNYGQRVASKLNGGSQRSSQAMNGSQGANRNRPDLYAELGERGRKTGVRVAPVERDEEGYEGVSNFFHSSPSAKAISSPGGRSVKSTIKKSASKKNVPVYQEEEYYNPNDGVDMGGGGGSDDEGDYTESMQLDDGSSLTPSAYQRSNPTTNRLPPTSLRHSTTASNIHSTKSKPNGSSRPIHIASSDDQNESDDDDDEEEEVVRRIMGASQNQSQKRKNTAGQGGLSMLGGGGGKKSTLTSAVKGKGKGRNVVESNSEEEEEEEEEEDPLPRGNKKSTISQSKSTAHHRGRLSNLSATSTSSNRSNRRDSIGTPSARLGKKGQEVAGDRKGKGKAVERVESEEEEEEEEEEQEEYFGGSGGDDEGGYDDMNQEGEQSMEQQSASEEEEQEEEEEPVARVSKNKGKGKNKARGSTSPQKNKKAAATAARKAQAEAKKKDEKVVSSKQTLARKRQREVDEDEEGVRRSSRQRLQPLEYWRNERVVYKRRQSGIAIEEVVRIPKAPAEPLAGKKKGGGGPRSGSTKVRVKSEPAPPEEEGIDDATDPDGIVWSWEGNAEVSRRIAFTAKMVDPRPTYNNKFMFQKIYTELDYLAGGILQIPAGAEKPTKPAKDNSYMFYCIEGSVSVVVHRTRFAIGPGATFFVPRGNSYSISATSNRDVKLFFTQGRRVIENDDGTTRPDTLEDSRRVSMGGQGGASPEDESDEGNVSEEEE